MADRQILASGTASVPADYTVQNAVEIMPKAVRAVLDGSGAAGDYVPTLEIISDAGLVVARAPLDATIAAGASADCSWFPRVGAAAGAASTLAPDWGTYFVDSVLVAAGGTATSVWHFNAGTALLTIPVLGPPTFNARGVYTVSAWVQSSDPWNGAALGGGRLGFGSPASFQQRQTGGVDAGGTMRNFGIQLTAQVESGQSVTLTFENFDTAGRNMYSNQVLIQKISGY